MDSSRSTIWSAKRSYCVELRLWRGASRLVGGDRWCRGEFLHGQLYGRTDLFDEIRQIDFSDCHRVIGEVFRQKQLIHHRRFLIVDFVDELKKVTHFVDHRWTKLFHVLDDDSKEKKSILFVLSRQQFEHRRENIFHVATNSVTDRETMKDLNHLFANRLAEKRRLLFAS